MIEPLLQPGLSRPCSSSHGLSRNYTTSCERDPGPACGITSSGDLLLYRLYHCEGSGSRPSGRAGLEICSSGIYSTCGAAVELQRGSDLCKSQAAPRKNNLYLWIASMDQSLLTTFSSLKVPLPRSTLLLPSTLPRPAWGLHFSPL